MSSPASVPTGRTYTSGSPPTRPTRSPSASTPTGSGRHGRAARDLIPQLRTKGFTVNRNTTAVFALPATDSVLGGNWTGDAGEGVHREAHHMPHGAKRLALTQRARRRPARSTATPRATSSAGNIGEEPDPVAGSITPVTVIV